MEAFRANPFRSLFYGLLSFTILMLLVAWGGIGELFVPPSAGPGIPLIEMPPPLLAINAAICALPLAAFVLILAGVSGTMRFVQGGGAKLIWKWRDHYLSVIGAAGLIVVFAFALFALVIVLVFFSLAGSALASVLGLGAGVALSTLPIAFGWYLMLIAGWAIEVVAQGRERTAVRAAVAWSGVSAFALIAVEVASVFLMGSAALGPNASIPPRVPWADAAAGVGGFSALLVLTVVARRVSQRYGSTVPTAPAPAA